MGAVDVVIELESRKSVARGLQRIGRAGHELGAVSKGRIFPKFRADLLESAVVAERMLAGEIEETVIPRNPLDVLAQQVVAICADEEIDVGELHDLVRGAYPFADLSRAQLENVLDMLSGRYPSDEFAELKPRIVWDRTGGTVRGRDGARRLAVTNAGTIPDRGLFGVHLVNGGGRVGELDEEIGDWRVCILTPFGARVHAPWAMAAGARLRDALGMEAQSIWSDDGIAFHLPDADVPPPTDELIPDPDELEDLVVAEVGQTA